jgi:FHS family L-fucose permease-like MFS transporter
MGAPETSHFRLNFAQAFNSLGAFLGGVVGAVFLLKGPLFEKDVVITGAMKAAGLSFAASTYLFLALVVCAFALLMFALRRLIEAHAPAIPAETVSPLSALRAKWARRGAVGIFVYVGAEVCVLSGMIFFLEQKAILNVPSQAAGMVGPLFMLFAMFGRFVGSALMTRIPAPRLLATCAGAAALLCLVVIATFRMTPVPLGPSILIPTFPGAYRAAVTTGFLPGCAAILIGLFNSIMFPTLFTLTLERSSAPASATSGLMCMAICGGGFVSVAYGSAVDLLTRAAPVGARSLAFMVPLCCYLYILWFATEARRAKTHRIEETATAGH